MGIPKTICDRWIYALSDSCLFHGWIFESACWDMKFTGLGGYELMQDNSCEIVEPFLIRLRAIACLPPEKERPIAA